MSNQKDKGGSAPELRTPMGPTNSINEPEGSDVLAEPEVLRVKAEDKKDDKADDKAKDQKRK